MIFTLKSDKNQCLSKVKEVKLNIWIQYQRLVQLFQVFWNLSSKKVPSQMGVSSPNHGHGSTESIPNFYTQHFTSKDLPLNLKDHLRVKLYQF